MTPIDSPTHSTAFAGSTTRTRLADDGYFAALLRRVTLSLGLLLVEWSARSGAHSSTRDADRAAAGRRAPTDHETLIRRHHTQRALEQEQRRAEARMLMAPLAR